LTLERWRWLPAFESPPIIVNIPQFRLFAFQSNETARRHPAADVIVGRTFPKCRRPFAADLNTGVRPMGRAYSITQREMLPRLRSNPVTSHTALEIVAGSDDAPHRCPTPENLARWRRALAAASSRRRQRPGLIKSCYEPLQCIAFNSRHQSSTSRPCLVMDVFGRRPVALAAHVLAGARRLDTDRGRGPELQRDSPRESCTAVHVLILYGTALSLEWRTLFSRNLRHRPALEQLLALTPVR